MPASFQLKTFSISIVQYNERELFDQLRALTHECGAGKHCKNARSASIDVTTLKMSINWTIECSEPVWFSLYNYIDGWISRADCSKPLDQNNVSTFVAKVKSSFNTHSLTGRNTPTWAKGTIFFALSLHALFIRYE